MRKAIVGTGLLLGLAGCVGIPVREPALPVVEPEVAIRQAEAAGAPGVPDAAQHLEWAREQTEGAHRLLEQNRREDAALFLLRAEADARLALALAHEAPVRAEADLVLQQVRQLQETVR